LKGGEEMSRAKRYQRGDIDLWFDYGSEATPEQLVLLADFSQEPIDDLLDSGLTQKEVARRLFSMEGLIPEHVLEARRRRREGQQNPPVCRWCSVHGLKCEGYSTRHHYVPRWLMLLLENYQAYAPRSLCTIPICLGRHRDLHLRGGIFKSISECLTERERLFAQKMLDELREEHPFVFDLLAGGDGNAYEAQLIGDYLSGEFRRDVSQDAMLVDSTPLEALAVGVTGA
jgi:hypothetical protein